MFLINITLKSDQVPADRADDMFAQHRAWFAKHFEAGTFVLLGPYQDREHAGIIIAQADSRAEIDAVLAEDVYHPQALADYEVREFTAAMAADKNLQGK